MKTEHNVPVNGRIRVILPEDMSIETSSLVNNCFRLDKSNRQTRLDCTANSSNNSFEVMVRSSTFGINGLQGNEQFQVQVSGFRNPKEVSVTVAFKIQSFDDSERLIDESDPSSGFTITMKSIGRLGSITVIPASATNGAATTYGFRVVPGVTISFGD